MSDREQPGDTPMRLYMNKGAQRMMARALDLTDELIASGDKRLIAEICMCGYEGIASTPHYCQLQIDGTDDE